MIVTFQLNTHSQPNFVVNAVRLAFMHKYK